MHSIAAVRHRCIAPPTACRPRIVLWVIRSSLCLSSSTVSHTVPSRGNHRGVPAPPLPAPSPSPSPSDNGLASLWRCCSSRTTQPQSGSHSPTPFVRPTDQKLCVCTIWLASSAIRSVQPRWSFSSTATLKVRVDRVVAAGDDHLAVDVAIGLNHPAGAPDAFDRADLVGGYLTRLASVVHPPWLPHAVPQRTRRCRRRHRTWRCERATQAG